MSTGQKYVGGEPHAKHTEGTVKNSAQSPAPTPLTREERAQLEALIGRVTTHDEIAHLKVLISNPSLVDSNERFYNPLGLTPEEVDAQFAKIGGVLPKSDYAVDLSIICATPNSVVKISVFETLVFALADYQTSNLKLMAGNLQSNNARQAYENHLNLIHCHELMMDLALSAAKKAAVNQEAHAVRNIGELRHKQGEFLEYEARFEELDEFAQEWLGRDYDRENNR